MVPLDQLPALVDRLLAIRQLVSTFPRQQPSPT
jgi:hypothetical protein